MLLQELKKKELEELEKTFAELGIALENGSDLKENGELAAGKKKKKKEKKSQEDGGDASPVREESPSVAETSVQDEKQEQDQPGDTVDPAVVSGDIHCFQITIDRCSCEFVFTTKCFDDRCCAGTKAQLFTQYSSHCIAGVRPDCFCCAFCR